MKRTIFLFLSFLCVIFLTFPTRTTSADIIVKIADHFPVTHAITKSLTKPWIARVEELSGKRVKFTHFPAQQLVKQNEAVGATQRRVVDIGLVNPGLFPTEFSLTGVSFLPNSYDSVLHGGRALQRLFQYPAVQDEFKRAGLRVILIVPFASYEALTNKSVKIPADMMGLKIRAAGEAQTAAVRALGGTPVMMNAPEIFTGLQRHTLDGMLFPYSNAKSYNFHEVAKYGTLNAKIGFANAVYCVNEAVWISWPTDVQAAMRKAAEEIGPLGWIESDKNTLEVIEFFKASGVIINDITKTGTIKEWEKMLKAVREQWATALKARGLAGQEVLDVWDKAVSGSR